MKLRSRIDPKWTFVKSEDGIQDKEMDAYSAAELSELYFQAQVVADTQFQYWLSVTFAVVVAGFVAGERLAQRLRYLAGILYLLTTALLIARFGRMVETSETFRQALIDSGVESLQGVGLAVAITRVAIFVLGTTAALYFLLRKPGVPPNRRS